MFHNTQVRRSVIPTLEANERPSIRTNTHGRMVRPVAEGALDRSLTAFHRPEPYPIRSTSELRFDCNVSINEIPM